MFSLDVQNRSVILQMKFTWKTLNLKVNPKHLSHQNSQIEHKFFPGQNNYSFSTHNSVEV